MEAYMKGDMKQGDEAMADARKKYATALAGCDAKVTQPIDDAKKKMDNLVSRKDWEDVEDKIYKANKA